MINKYYTRVDAAITILSRYSSPHGLPGSRLLRPLNVQGLHDLFKLGVTAQPCELGLDLCLQVLHDPESVVKRLRTVAQIVDCVHLERRGSRTLLQDVFANSCHMRIGPVVMPRRTSDSLSTWRLEVSARMPWTTGKENFPSVRSSAKPLFSVYCLWYYVRWTMNRRTIKRTCVLCRFM